MPKCDLFPLSMYVKRIQGYMSIEMKLAGKKCHAKRNLVRRKEEFVWPQKRQTGGNVQGVRKKKKKTHAKKKKEGAAWQSMQLKLLRPAPEQ